MISMQPTGFPACVYTYVCLCVHGMKVISLPLCKLHPPPLAYYRLGQKKSCKYEFPAVMYHAKCIVCIKQPFLAGTKRKLPGDRTAVSFFPNLDFYGECSNEREREREKETLLIDHGCLIFLEAKCVTENEDFLFARKESNEKQRNFLL